MLSHTLISEYQLNNYETSACSSSTTGGPNSQFHFLFSSISRNHEIANDQNCMLVLRKRTRVLQVEIPKQSINVDVALVNRTMSIQCQHGHQSVGLISFCHPRPCRRLLSLSIFIIFSVSFTLLLDFLSLGSGHAAVTAAVTALASGANIRKSIAKRTNQR